MGGLLWSLSPTTPLVATFEPEVVGIIVVFTKK
jgi:hypothetical protein